MSALGSREPYMRKSPSRIGTASRLPDFLHIGRTDSKRSTGHWATMGVKGGDPPLQDSPRLRGRLSASALCGKPKGNLAPVNAGWFRPDHVGVELGDGHVRPLQASGRAMSVSYYPAMRGSPALRGFPAVFWGHPLARGRLCAIRQSVRTDRKAFRFASICR